MVATLCCWLWPQQGGLRLRVPSHSLILANLLRAQAGSIRSVLDMVTQFTFRHSSPALCPTLFPQELALCRPHALQGSWEVEEIIIFPLTVLPRAGPGAGNLPWAEPAWWRPQLSSL